MEQGRPETPSQVQSVGLQQSSKGSARETMVFSTCGAGTGHPHAKKISTQTLHFSQKLTQNGS